ncbi:MAG: cyclic nucleotide-binding domain-containing protein [Myxococcales bacterium]|nr:cyclic nucleotide-binding domain-containing protein [Myxococcales bacterium]
MSSWKGPGTGRSAEGSRAGDTAGFLPRAERGGRVRRHAGRCKRSRGPRLRGRACASIAASEPRCHRHPEVVCCPPCPRERWGREAGMIDPEVPPTPAARPPANVARKALSGSWQVARVSSPKAARTSSVLRPGARHADVVAFLGRQPFMAEFAHNELQALASVMESRIYHYGENILDEGVACERLCFIYRGAADVLKCDATTGEAFVLTRLGRGAIVGEMSFMDGEPTSATVRAAQGCVVLFVSRTKLTNLTAEAGRLLQAKLTRAVALAVIRRLRELSGAHVEVMRAELDQEKLRSEFARFFIVTMVLFALASMVQKVISQDLPPTRQMLFSWGFLLLTFAPIAWFGWRQRLPWSAWGLTTGGVGRSLLESLGVGTVLVATACLVRVLQRAPGEPLLSWGSLHNYTSAEFLAFLLLYGPHSFFQELIGRGVIQGSLQRFMGDAGRMAPVLVTSALFGIFHLYVSLSFAAVTFAASVLFGWLYQRHGTLIGVTALHYAIGMASVAIGFN